MKFRRKNKGFTLIETLIVVSVIAILAGIIANNSALQHEKAEIMQVAGDIRNLYIETQANAAKIQQKLKIDFLGGTHGGTGMGSTKGIAAYYIIGTDMFNTNTNNLVKSFESGGSRIVNLSKMNFADLRNVANGILFTNNADGSLTLNATTNDRVVIITPRRTSFTDDASTYHDAGQYSTTQDDGEGGAISQAFSFNGGSVSNVVQFYVIEKGMFCAIVEFANGGNVNIYIAKKIHKTDRYFTSTLRYYPAKI